MYAKPNKLAYLPYPNTRLFIYIDTNYLTCKVGQFTVFTILKEKLGLNLKLLQEVQEVKSDFTLVTGSLEAFTALELRAPERLEYVSTMLRALGLL